MSSTPRRGVGGFPATPQTNRSPGLRSPAASTPSRPNVGTLPDVPKAAPASTSSPLISTDILNFGQQRTYATAIWAVLWAFKLWDFYELLLGQGDSLALCLKWVMIDAVFIFCIPLFGIERLEWSNNFCLLVWLAHVVANIMLMFQIMIPFQYLLTSALAPLFDSEAAIGERSVKPGRIIHNSSLIMGKQTVNILPEGSAILNPYHSHFCLSPTVTHVEVPIRINQTEPIEIELLRLNIETNANETITLKKGEVKSMLHKARRRLKNIDPADPLELNYTIKKPGIYVLSRVVDRSRYDVRTRRSSVVVVTCPKAQVKPTGDHRCRNDPSNVELQVEGVPPLRVKYRTTVEGRPREAAEFQDTRPEGYSTPLTEHNSQALVREAPGDVSWARSRIVTLPLNETLAYSGTWLYEIEEVRDTLGNLVSYASYEDDDRSKTSVKGVRQSFRVHERPTIVLDDCTPQKPLRIAKGHSARLPLKFDSTGKGAIRDAKHTVEYLFTTDADLLPDGYHSDRAELNKQTLKSLRDQPLITTSGLYTLKSVSTEFCEGDVLEPASCLLQNPPEPQLSFTYQNIEDQCKGNPVGVQVALDLIGTPPFTVKYTVQRDRERPQRLESRPITSLRGDLELKPSEAGHYVYTFESIKDWVYPERSLRGLTLEQDVKPSASAHFIEAPGIKQACIDESVEFDVKLLGEGPWKLKYEIVHNGKRTKHEEKVAEENFTIKTQKLKSGGEYTITLTSVTDTMNCNVDLKDEAKVNIRHEKPRAYFGPIDSKFAVQALEGKTVALPLRLTGVAPWTLQYENLDSGETMTKLAHRANDQVDIRTEGTYQLQSVFDSLCPGDIDDKASQFTVGRIPRPTISVVTSDDSPSMIFEGGKYVKEAVCEGDDDTFDVLLSGNPPYELSYEETFKDKKSMKVATRGKKDLRALGGSASIRADTSKAGTYEYKFSKLADSKYDHSRKHFSSITVQQIVNPLPSARFVSPGKTYSFCSREAEGDGVEVIPVSLEGVTPFYLEVEIKHQGAPKPEVSVHKNIPSNKYDLKIEHRKLHLGTSSITIRKVRDARGCTLKPPPGGPRVQISVHDAPSATPLEDRVDFCVGERPSFALGGQTPFTVFYTFEGTETKVLNTGTTFRRIAGAPGTFTITGVKDSASECLAPLSLTKEIHPLPAINLDKGQVSRVDIHEGGGTDLEFEFWGTPPFEFTYIRRTSDDDERKSKVLDVRSAISHSHYMRIHVQEAGSYEAISIKDKWCSAAKQVEGVDVKGGHGQKLLQY